MQRESESRNTMKSPCIYSFKVYFAHMYKCKWCISSSNHRGSLSQKKICQSWRSKIWLYNFDQIFSMFTFKIAGWKKLCIFCSLTTSWRTAVNRCVHFARI